MIKYNNSNINDWYYEEDNLIKVYRNGATVYYKVITSGDTPEYKVCYAVVDDIAQYSETEFDDVFNNADEKWYKLNNLNQYEEYGVYGSGRNITYYQGKLTIDDGYEYMYSGSSWVNVGEVSGSTATLPDVPFSVNYNANNYNANTKTLAKTSGQLVDVDAVITAGTPTVNDGYLTIASGTRATISGYQTYFNRTNTNGSRALTIVSKQRTEGNYCHMFANRDGNYNWMYRCYATRLTLHGGSETGGVAVTTQPVIESVMVKDSSPMITYNNYTDGTSSTTDGFSYGSTNSGNFALFQGYATSTGENFVGDFYWVYMSQNTLTDDQVQQVIDYNEGGGGQSEYPLYYDEKTDPLNNLSFSSMTEAQDYAYNNCVYDGMKATIDGDRYYFDSDDENGWVKILSYYTVEDVTPGGASGWTITGSSVYNPNRSYYDDFSVALNISYQTKVAKVTIYGYENFTYYLRSTGYSSYAYATSSNVDELTAAPTSMSYNSSSAITNTYNFNKAAGSAVNLSNYRRVTYNNLDKTVEHTFYVVFYNGYYTSSYTPSATLLIPKEQTNENWEQVTFSASSNVASAQKSLYIDGNNSTSGGTQYWYYIWMVGLPSGSHSSYCNYSNISYCPNVTSSTFTSVAGEQRQVNFSWTTQSTKSLSFRLTDTSGNTLSPSDTVYFNYTGYNACNSSSSSSNQTYPRSQTVYVGGRFRLGSSSNRHYIYGYSPSVSLNTDYYVDNYNTYFDITYTKLSTEAVTISYTTYDPGDTETPTFSTKVSWPYGNSGSTSFTTTSYDIPYTYTYTAECTSNLFSASTSSYSYTAGQTSRAISFTLYPNNREFSTVADLEAYAYAWEGMIAYVGADRYVYQNGEWVYNPSKDSDFVIGDFNTFVSSSTEVTEGYYIIYYYGYNSSYADKNYLLSWNSGNTWSGYYTLGNMNHSDTSTSVPISSSEIIDDAVWEFKDAGNGYFYIRNVGTNKYWYYLGANTSYGVPLTDNANDATPVSIQDWRSCLAFVEKQNSNNYPINRLYNYPFRYGWHGSLSTDGNNQYYMRKYVP